MSEKLTLLNEACFQLAREIKSAFKPVDTDEIKMYADQLATIAKEKAKNGQESGITIPLVTRAIHYLRQTHAIPPMADDTRWFDYMLMALLEVTWPDSVLEGEAREFLKDMQNGIGTYLNK